MVSLSNYNYSLPNILPNHSLSNYSIELYLGYYTYKIELPGDDYGVSSTFNVADLSPFFGGDDPASRTTPFQEGEGDEGIPSSLPSSATIDQATSVEAPDLPSGPITRARAKLLKEQVNLFLAESHNVINEHFILPKNSVLLVLRFDYSEMDRDQGYAAVIPRSPSKEDAQVLAHGPCDQGEDYQAQDKVNQGTGPYNGARSKTHQQAQGPKPQEAQDGE